MPVLDGFLNCPDSNQFRIGFNVQAGANFFDHPDDPGGSSSIFERNNTNVHGKAS
jgi:hypothetical protein